MRYLSQAGAHTDETGGRELNAQIARMILKIPKGLLGGSNTGLGLQAHYD
jgi:hypothetical protein